MTNKGDISLPNQQPYSEKSTELTEPATFARLRSEGIFIPLRLVPVRQGLRTIGEAMFRDWTGDEIGNRFDFSNEVMADLSFEDEQAMARMVIAIEEEQGRDWRAALVPALQALSILESDVGDAAAIALKAIVQSPKPSTLHWLQRRVPQRGPGPGQIQGPVQNSNPVPDVLTDNVLQAARQWSLAPYDYGSFYDDEPSARRQRVVDVFREAASREEIVVIAPGQDGPFTVPSRFWTKSLNVEAFARTGKVGVDGKRLNLLLVDPSEITEVATLNATTEDKSAYASDKIFNQKADARGWLERKMQEDLTGEHRGIDDNGKPKRKPYYIDRVKREFSLSNREANRIWAGALENTKAKWGKPGAPKKNQAPSPQRSSSNT